MRQLLLDTSVIIDFLRAKDKTKTLLYSLSEEDLHTSIITHTELYAGKSVWENKVARKELENLFSGIKILPLETDASIRAGYFKSRHKNTSLLDCIISSTAISFNLELVTLNIKDFKGMEGLRLLREVSN